ncbi:MAG: transporter substrate-binding domain-containing protein [Mogibacterium sp.]|nr:transporter substrate-binding domain-containing protein [Mogibacterium sp.]
MKGLKKFLVLILGIVMVFSLAACGGGSSDEAATEEPAAEEESTEVDVAAAYNKILEELNNADVQTDGQITVATSPDFAPMEFVDLSRQGDEQYVGYDILLAKYIANHLGKELVIKPMAFDAVQAAVQTGNVDMGISGFSWTAERAENYFITDWYEAGDNETEQVVITTKANEGKLTTADSYNGLKVGAQGGSLQKILVEEQLPGAECVLMQDLNDLCTALLTGKIDALAVAFGNGESFISANPDDLIFSGFQFEVDDLYKNNVVLINKNNTELGEAVNAIIAQQKADGVADSWYEASQLLSEIKTIDELGYDEEGNKITE